MKNPKFKKSLEHQSLEYMTPEELAQVQIKLLSNMNKNIRTITTLIIISFILAILGGILL